jgi:glucose/mannose-6-phosphate isomerase
MGGSSLPADLVNDHLWGQCSLQIIRDYRLPPDADGEDLALCASYSGNTEETIATLDNALHRHCTVVALSHGGQLRELAESKNIPFLKIPHCIQPRCATGYFFAATLGLLHRFGFIASPHEELAALRDFLIPRQAEYEARGREIASLLKDRIPIIYGPTSLQGACRIWKIKFNENSKVQSFFNVFPELNHNEMVGFTRLLMSPSIIYLRSKFMPHRINLRMETMKEILSAQIPFIEIALSGDSLLKETFESLAIGDYASYHLALGYGIDPAPVELVETFKGRLK